MTHPHLTEIQRLLTFSSCSFEDQRAFIVAIEELDSAHLQAIVELFLDLPGTVPVVVGFYQLKKLALEREDALMWQQILREEAAFLQTFS